MLKSIILIITIIICVPESNTLSGYMCGRNSSNFTSVMTSTIGGCDVPLKNPESQKVYLQLLQHLAYRKVELFSCKVLVHHVIRYCGAFSHNKIVAGGDSSIIQPLEIPTWNYEEIRSFMTSGIYSVEELEKLEDHMAFPLKRQALLESVVR
ncbi:hypothetical protein TKK_0014525 [Trichogramma kaykai]